MTMDANLLAAFEEIAADVAKRKPIVFSLGGQFLLDPNELNGWGVLGPTDNTNSQDLGDVGGTTPNRLSGGLSYPFDVRVNRLFVWHQNSNANAEAWGWRMFRQQKTDGANTQVSVDLLNEVNENAGVAPRDYSSTVTQLTDIDLSASSVVPAGEVIVLGVESPTAVTTNYYVRLMSGYIELERV